MNKTKLTHRFVGGVHLFFIAALLAGLAVIGAPVPAAHAAGIVVNSTADVIADDGECTLREAIIAANTNTASGATAGECAAGEAAPTVDVITFTDLAGSPDLYTLAILAEPSRTQPPPATSTSPTT